MINSKQSSALAPQKQVDRLSGQSIPQTLEARKAFFVAEFEKLSHRSQKLFIQLLEIMVAEPEDVYFLVCLEGKLIYQGFSVDSAVKANSDVLGKYINQFEINRTKLSCSFLCICPDNTVLNFGIDRGMK